jgi:hypothetical protein
MLSLSIPAVVESANKLSIAVVLVVVVVVLVE